MSNYTKSFNFRNGVQVDDDNFVVNAAGLVGIGTTKPEKLLDVRGNASITGVTSLTGAVVSGIITVGTIKIDASSGVLTATKFVGDASGLTNIVAIATDGWIKNAGTLSTTGKVGVGSTSPTSQFEVLGDSKLVGFTTLTGITTSIGELFANQLSVSGVSTFVGLSTFTNIFVSAASTFTGAIDANGGATVDNIQIGVTGDNEIDTSTGNLTIDSAGGTVVIDDQANVSGILTAKSFSGPTGTAATFTNGIVVGTGVTIESGGQANFVGFVTFNNSVEIDANLDVDGHTELDNVRISGVTTVGEITSGGGLVSLTLKGNPVEIKSSKSTAGSMFKGSDGGSVELYNNNVKKFETISVGSSVYGQLNIGSLNGGTSALSTHFGSVKYGNENESFGYSTRRSLDLINTDSGNVNFYINYDGITDTPTGNFHWLKGDNPKMTLVANTGNLGIGETEPTETLHVAGIITTTSDLFVATNLSVKGNLEMTGALSQVNAKGVNGTFAGPLTGLVNATTGVSTFLSIRVTDKTETQFDGFGINKTPDAGNMVDIIGDSGTDDSKVFVNNDGNIGIGTTRIDDTININALQAKATLGAVGGGTTNPQAVIDFRYAGQDQPATIDGNPNPAFGRMYAYLPMVTGTQETALVGMAVGALIFNTSTEKLKYYSGSGAGLGWKDVNN